MNPVVQPDKHAFRCLGCASTNRDDVEVKVGDFYLRKMKTYLKCLDLDGDGFVTRKDFEILAERRGQICNLTPVQAQQGYNEIMRIFDNFFPSDGDSEVRLTPEDFAKGFLTKSRDFVIIHCAVWHAAQFQIADIEGKGAISRENFRLFHKIFNINDQEATDKAFDIIDKDGSGTLSLMEIVQAGVDFFISEDEN